MERRFRALIVDDEKFARADLRRLLDKFPQVDVVGEAFDVASAIHAIEQLRPDVIFLDIEFRGETGFDLLKRIDTRVKIIFVTAFDEYAIRAFEVNACDYLLKPVNPDRLARALARLERESDIKHAEPCRLEYNDRLFLDLNYRYYFFRVDTIVTITAASNYSEIVTTRGIKGMTRKSLQEWEACLPEHYFARIHRSVMINTELVERIGNVDRSEYLVFMKGIPDPLHISRRYLKKLRGSGRGSALFGKQEQSQN